jgi:hypothetical protein
MAPAVWLLIGIRDVRGLCLRRDIGYPKFLGGFLQPLQAVPEMRPQPLTSPCVSSFVIH